MAASPDEFVPDKAEVIGRLEHIGNVVAEVRDYFRDSPRENAFVSITADDIAEDLYHIVYSALALCDYLLETSHEARPYLRYRVRGMRHYKDAARIE